MDRGIVCFSIRGRLPPSLRVFLSTFRNRPFVQLIVAYLIANTAFALIKTLLTRQPWQYPPPS
jgi:hypothetical protein